MIKLITVLKVILLLLGLIEFGFRILSNDIGQTIFTELYEEPRSKFSLFLVKRGFSGFVYEIILQIQEILLID